MCVRVCELSVEEYVGVADARSVAQSSAGHFLSARHAAAEAAYLYITATAATRASATSLLDCGRLRACVRVRCVASRD